MKLDDFIFYSYLSIMLPILIAMFIGLIILGVSHYSNTKQDEILELEDFTYRLQNKTDKELISLEERYISYLTDLYLMDSSEKWYKYIDAIQKHMEQRSEREQQR